MGYQGMKALLSYEMRAHAPEVLSVGQDVEEEDGDIGDPGHVQTTD